MAKILPILLLLIGLGAGVGAGIMLRPPPPPPEEGKTAEKAEEGHEETAEEEADDTIYDYVKLNNQFVVPIIRDGKVSALVVLTLSLEIEAGDTSFIYEKEPKLRDAFLDVLFDHANAGGFDGTFTAAQKIEILRKALSEVARKVMGPQVKSVLIADLVRQDT